MLPPVQELFRRPRKEHPVIVTTSFSVTPTDELIIRALGRYTYLTTEQLYKLLLITDQRPARAAHPRGQGKDPLRPVQRRCLELERNEYLAARFLASDKPGRPSKIHWLEHKGKELVAEL